MYVRVSESRQCGSYHLEPQGHLSALHHRDSKRRRCSSRWLPVAQVWPEEGIRIVPQWCSCHSLTHARSAGQAKLQSAQLLQVHGAAMQRQEAGRAVLGVGQAHLHLRQSPLARRTSARFFQDSRCGVARGAVRSLDLDLLARVVLIDSKRGRCQAIFLDCQSLEKRRRCHPASSLAFIRLPIGELTRCIAVLACQEEAH